jgi:hypothetical protein
MLIDREYLASSRRTSNKIMLNLYSSFIVWMSEWFDKIRGRRPTEDGWEAVATEGDEPMEMVEGRSYR